MANVPIGNGPDPPVAGPPAFGRLAGRISRHTLIYASASISVIVIGLANVAVVTRFLEPAEFGKLAVLFFFATVLTVLYNAGSLQGTLAWVHGSTGDDEALGGDESAKTASDPRRALLTGILLTGVIGALGTVAVVQFAADLAEWLISDRDDADLVILTGVGAALAAIWRLTANTIRLQRRPVAYLISTASVHALGLGIAIPLLASGWGIRGAVTGVAIGNAISTGCNLLVLRCDIRPAVAWSDVVHIFRRGRALVPVVFSFYTIQLGDVFFASRYLTAAEVGLYRVGSRVGSLMSYWSSSFLMAWGPMRRDPLHVAADAEKGRLQTATVLVTYFMLITFGLLLIVGVFAEELVKIAAGSYAGAAGVIPLAAAAFACHGLYILVYRASEAPNLRRWFIGLSVASAVAFVIAAILLIPRLGIYGPSTAAIVGWSVGILGLFVKSQRGPKPVPYQYPRIAGGLVLAGGCYAGARSAGVSGWSGVGVDLASIVAYPMLMAITGVIPRHHLAVLRTMQRTYLLERRRRRLERDVLAALSPFELRLIDLLVRKRLPPAEVAAASGVREEHVLRRLVWCLRRVWGEAGTRDCDELLGAHLLSSAPFAERQHQSVRIFELGVDPLEFDRLHLFVSRLRRIPEETWAQIVDVKRPLSKPSGAVAAEVTPIPPDRP